MIPSAFCIQSLDLQSGFFSIIQSRVKKIEIDIVSKWKQFSQISNWDCHFGKVNKLMLRALVERVEREPIILQFVGVSISFYQSMIGFSWETNALSYFESRKNKKNNQMGISPRGWVSLNFKFRLRCVNKENWK